ncbi:MAG: DUF6051 family protein [Bacteroidales bacterium]
MEYTKLHNQFKSLYDPSLREMSIGDRGMKIFNIDFTSDIRSDRFFNTSDITISENNSFSYPVFVPRDADPGKTILLLHGLNERTWTKYLVWAYYLADNTGSSVILFPISFHVNRSPESWRDPRSLFETMNDRKSIFGNINKLSFANIALSKRLTDDPRRFFNSGYQTVNDIVKLMTIINEGRHPVISGGKTVNIFAYSIGAFLAQILMMGNPSGLFSDSKLFMFCGGSVFSNMHGTSKLIMDGLAYEKVYRYYLDEFEKSFRSDNPFTDYLQTNKTGIAFRSMIDLGRLKEFREKALRKLREQIGMISLEKDIVIPPSGIIDTMKPAGDHEHNPVRIWNFPYPYSHENPFPIYEGDISLQVDYWFERLFSEAVTFFR